MEKFQCWFLWFKQTSIVVGMPVTLMLVVLALQAFFFTGTCYTVGYYCEHALGGAENTVDAVKEILDANPGKSLIIK